MRVGAEARRRGVGLKVAEAENISVDEFLASAFEERVLEFERLKDRAARGSYEKFLRVMSKVPAVDPPAYDRFQRPPA
jgi:adenosine deaminase